MADIDPLALVDWRVPPPDDLPVYMPILSPKPGTVIRGTIVSSALVGVWTHWDKIGRRTEPHLEGGCARCREGSSRRWKGYLGIDYPPEGRLCLAELTLYAVQHCREVLAPAGGSLRGWLIEISRPGNKSQGRVACCVQPPPIRRPESRLPKEPDIRRALLNVWDRRQDGPTGLLAVGEDPDAVPF